MEVYNLFQGQSAGWFAQTGQTQAVPGSGTGSGANCAASSCRGLDGVKAASGKRMDRRKP